MQEPRAPVEGPAASGARAAGVDRPPQWKPVATVARATLATPGSREALWPSSARGRAANHSCCQVEAPTPTSGLCDGYFVVMAGSWQPDSEIYRRAMNRADADPHDDARGLLREGLRDLRRRAAVLAAKIETDLPEYTVHDEAHLDALWPLIDLMAPTGFVLAPSEAFVLGGAILLHDLGLAVTAYPGGREELRSGSRWRQTLGASLRADFGRAPRGIELEQPSAEVMLSAERQLLREQHADRARDLGLVSWIGADGDKRYLLQSEELRSDFGHIIGEVAASHWLPVAQLPAVLPWTTGAPSHGPYPGEWTVRPVLLACLLRVADAAHLDARRAPHWVRLHRDLNPASVPHWEFQARLHQATKTGDRLTFTGTPFPVAEAAAWWLCFEALRMVDLELRQVNALLGDRNDALLSVRAVSGVEDGRRLAEYIPTHGWEPVDATVHVSNLASLVERLGGSALYRDLPYVPLRELVQNASDAILARRAVDATYEGSVRVRAGTEPSPWLEVGDDGVGMRPDVMTGALLDFGKSIWKSPDIVRVAPDLASTEFEATGEFGIGFFSVFMWADRVEVTSRHFRAGSTDCYRLDFGSGLGARPVLCRVSGGLEPPGTRVRLWLKETTSEAAWQGFGPEDNGLARVCAWLAPALPVDLTVDTGTGEVSVIKANDWLTIEGGALCLRLYDGDEQPSLGAPHVAQDVSERFSIVRDGASQPIARAGLRSPDFISRRMC
jgi:hypothetical protein